MAGKEKSPVYKEALVWGRLSSKRVKYPKRNAHAIVGNKGWKLTFFIRNLTTASGARGMNERVEHVGLF